MAARRGPGPPKDTLLIGLCWFGTSAVVSTYANTAFLQHFDSAYLLTLVRFFGSALLGAVTYTCSPAAVSLRGIWPTFVPSALLLIGANYTNSVSLQLSGITLTYVVKSSIPVVTVLINALQGKTFSTGVYLSIVPTVVGVALAAWSDMNFSATGFAAALASMLMQTLLNVQSKEAIRRTGVGGAEAQFIMVSICSVVLFAPALLVLASGSSALTAHLESHSLAEPTDQFLISLAAVAYHCEYVLNFIFTSKVEPLAFSIADIARRLSIIFVGAFLFDKTLTMVNKIGICICFMGVAWYSSINQTKTSKSRG